MNQQNPWRWVRGHNPDHLRKGKPVTIAAGFRFVDGILLCADTQYSSTRKTHESKIFRIQHGAAHIVLILTGWESYGKRTAEMIAERVKAVPLRDLTKENLHNAIEAELGRMFKTHIYPHPDWGKESSPDFQFVVGLYSPTDGTFLMKTENDLLITLDDKVCLGSGGYLGDYLGRMYLGSTQSLNDIVAFATYLFHEVKAHDVSCGGKSEFMVVRNTGEISPITTQDIALAEEYSSSFNEASTDMFYAVADLEKSDDERDQKMLKAHEKLLLSLTYRKDKKEQERLVKTLERKLMEDMGEALGGKPA